MPSLYTCPRCQRTYRRFWLLSGRCDDCGVTLGPHEPPLLREYRARCESVELKDLEGWPPLAAGVRVWRATFASAISYPPVDLLIEQPTGEVSRLERREQLRQVGVLITTPAQALDYVRLLHGRRSLYHTYGLEGLGPLARQEPSYIEPVRRLRVFHEIFEIAGLDGSLPPPSAHEHREGDQRCFRVTRHVLPRESLPTEVALPCPLPSLLQLTETVWLDGRYACEASDLPPQETGYRSDAAPSFAPLTIVLTERRPPEVRP